MLVKVSFIDNCVSHNEYPMLLLPSANYAIIGTDMGLSLSVAIFWFNVGSLYHYNDVTWSSCNLESPAPFWSTDCSGSQQRNIKASWVRTHRKTFKSTLAFNYICFNSGKWLERYLPVIATLFVAGVVSCIMLSSILIGWPFMCMCTFTKGYQMSHWYGFCFQIQ